MLAAQWRVLLGPRRGSAPPKRLDGLCISDLGIGSDDEHDLDLGEPLSERNVAAAVLAGCKARLFGGRRDALEALR